MRKLISLNCIYLIICILIVLCHREWSEIASLQTGRRESIFCHFIWELNSVSCKGSQLVNHHTKAVLVLFNYI